jgi:hypothetical protein
MGLPAGISGPKRQALKSKKICSSGSQAAHAPEPRYPRFCALPDGRAARPSGLYRSAVLGHFNFEMPWRLGEQTPAVAA